MIVSLFFFMQTFHAEYHLPGYDHAERHENSINVERALLVFILRDNLSSKYTATKGQSHKMAEVLVTNEY